MLLNETYRLLLSNEDNCAKTDADFTFSLNYCFVVLKCSIKLHNKSFFHSSNSLNKAQASFQNSTNYFIRPSCLHKTRKTECYSHILLLPFERDTMDNLWSLNWTKL